MSRQPRRRKLRYQHLSRARHGRVSAWLVDQALRFGVPMRAVRDRLRQLGPLSPTEVAAAVDAAAAGVVRMTGSAYCLFNIDARTLTRGAGSWLEDGFSVGDTARIIVDPSFAIGPFTARVTGVTAGNLALEPGTFGSIGMIITGPGQCTVYRLSPRGRD